MFDALIREHIKAGHDIMLFKLVYRKFITNQYARENTKLVLAVCLYYSFCSSSRWGEI